MKKILLSIFALFSLIISYSQAIFSHDFESGTISPITTVNNDGFTKNKGELV